MNPESLTETLAQIDQAIDSLLREGKLTPHGAKLCGLEAETTNRVANLKTLLKARKHYRELLAKQHLS